MEITKLLIEKIKNTTNYDDHIKYIDDRLFNDKRYLIESNKLEKLGWKQTIELKNYLKYMINI